MLKRSAREEQKGELTQQTECWKSRTPIVCDLTRARAPILIRRSNLTITSKSQFHNNDFRITRGQRGSDKDRPRSDASKVN